MTTQSAGNTLLVADIGGTHARFAVVDRAAELKAQWETLCSLHSSVVEAIRSYFHHTEVAPPRRARIAVASPVTGDDVQMTNHDWRFSIETVRDELGFGSLDVVNDFIALAYALPRLSEEHQQTIRAGHLNPTAALGVIGPGTGLGVSGLVPTPDGWVAFASEGGHRDLAASNEREWAILQVLKKRFGHVSAERVLSGPGLVHLYQAICVLEDREPSFEQAAEIVSITRSGDCDLAAETLSVFSRQLGAIAGDLALTLGARGGIFLAGGMLPRMRDAFDAGLFSDAFVEKGRFRAYLEEIPVQLVLDPHATLSGAALMSDTNGIASRSVSSLRSNS